MASQSLYRKWRSQTFSDLVGQEAVVRVLAHAVRDGRLAHAYLFCGPRGTGKTTAARLLAKAVNCAQLRDGEPCNACLSCREIAEGRSPDVIEIDAASNNSVDNIRELRGTVNVLSTGGRYKVYVLDEAHMLSPQAFNALLKTLEEPPPHVLFVLATTEPHKVLPTIVSRCQSLYFRRISRRDITARLRQVAEGEGLRLDPAAADVLSRAAQGGLRDALSLLDQAMAYCGQEIGLEAVQQMLGVADAGALRRLVEHVAAGQAAEGLQLINELVEAGAELRQLNTQLAELWRALLLARVGADLVRILDCGPEEARELGALAGQFTAEELAACARAFTANETPARGLPVPQLALELAYLECLGARRSAGTESRPSAAPAGRVALPPGTPPAISSAAVPALPRSAGAPSMGRAETVPSVEAAANRDMTGASVVATREGADVAAPPQEELATGPALDARPATEGTGTVAAPQASSEREPEPGLVWEIGADASGDVAPGDEAPGDEAGPTGPASDAGQSDWLERAREQWELVKKVCKQRRRTVAALLHSSRPIMVAPGDPLEVVLQVDYQFHLEKLREPASRADVEWALEQVLERRCHVRLVLAGAAGPDGAGGSAGSPGPAGAPGNGSAPSRAGDDGRSGGAPRGLVPGDGQAPGQEGAAHRIDGNGVPEKGGAGTAGQVEAPGGSEGSGVRDGGSGYGEVPRVDAKGHVLEDEARADPVIQEIMRAFPAELIEVRPIGPTEGD